MSADEPGILWQAAKIAFRDTAAHLITAGMDADEAASALLTAAAEIHAAQHGRASIAGWLVGASATSATAYATSPSSAAH